MCIVITLLTDNSKLYVSTGDLEYFFHNNTIIFNGNYSVGESECVAMDVSVPDDNVVKGIKEIETEISGICISIFIIDNDCKHCCFKGLNFD